MFDYLSSSPLALVLPDLDLANKPGETGALNFWVFFLSCFLCAVRSDRQESGEARRKGRLGAPYAAAVMVVFSWVVLPLAARDFL
jgi:hypothetical protein